MDMVFLLQRGYDSRWQNAQEMLFNSTYEAKYIPEWVPAGAMQSGMQA